MRCGRLGLAHEVVQGRDEIDDALAADPVVAREDRANRRMQVAGKGVFEDDAARANVERLDDLLGGDGRGKENDLDRGRAVHDGAHGLKAGQARHLDIEQEDVGGLLQSLGDGFIAIVGFAYDFEAVALGEHVAHTNADYRMIISQDDADRLLFHESPKPPKKPELTGRQRKRPAFNNMFPALQSEHRQAWTKLEIPFPAYAPAFA